jgi:hypothetical protein
MTYVGPEESPERHPGSDDDDTSKSLTTVKKEEPKKEPEKKKEQPKPVGSHVGNWASSLMAANPAPQLHKGGTVPKDGVYELEKGEEVVPKDKKMAKKKHAGHGYKHTHITHHDDGSHTMHHEHEDGMSHKDYAVASLDHAHDGLQDHLGMPNPGEEEAEGGQSGIPEGGEGGGQ